MLTSQDTCRRHVCGRGHHLVFGSADDITLALHHGIETVVGDVGGIILFGGPDGRIHHFGTPKELRLLAPGMRQVTVTPVSLSSSRKANEKEFRKALVPL